jgi:hypothetical protein
MSSVVKHIAVVVLTSLLFACGNEEKEVSTDMIYFPSSAGDAEDTRELPKMTFEADSLHFGTIAQGEKVRKTYVFENTGEAPLLIARVETSCGCTAMRDWPKTPISPGESAEIEVEFDSHNRSGFQRKTITVMANTVPSKNVVLLTGEVVAPSTNP